MKGAATDVVFSDTDYKRPVAGCLQKPQTVFDQVTEHPCICFSPSTGIWLRAGMQVQAEEARRRQVREVAYDLQRRVKQELAFPAVIHFYCWLLQGDAENYLI